MSMQSSGSATSSSIKNIISIKLYPFALHRRHNLQVAMQNT